VSVEADARIGQGQTPIYQPSLAALATAFLDTIGHVRKSLTTAVIAQKGNQGEALDEGGNYQNNLLVSREARKGRGFPNPKRTGASGRPSYLVGMRLPGV
jgi:hypothetical protein